MDFYQQEQVLSPSCSKLGSLPSNGSLDDLFAAQNTEVDVSLEWLSIFVEDCFSSTGNCLPPAATPTTGNKNNNLQNPTAPTKSIHQNESTKKNPPKNSSFMLQKLMNIPGKARSKRKRTTQFKNNNIINNHNSYYSDTLLLQQSHWLADSELIHFPTNKNTNHTELLPKDSDEMTKKGEKGEEAEEKQEKGSLKISHGGGGGGGGGGQARRCSHCLAQRTPQWRAGPMGPKTLCNACGVRYKSGRLLPEYRPAKSPTFSSNLHSNSHKKVMEMRMTLPPSSLSK